MNHSHLLLTGSILLSACAAEAQPVGKQPNIILIMADDMGWGDVGFTGNPIIRTPNLDRLASEGVLLQHFYSSGPLSSPTRAGVLTGRNPFRTGVFSANVGILRPEEITIPELLHQAGYRTGHFGKWHLGTLTYTEIDANRGRPENKNLYNPPAQHGYDVAFVTESKVPTCDPMIAPVNNDGQFWDYIRPNESSVSYGTYYWDIDGNKVTDGLSGDDSRVIIDRVLPFIDGAVQAGKPFFGAVWFHAPHLPCVAAPEFAELYKEYPTPRKNYYGCITALDSQVGRLVDYLKKAGLYENTILMFCSDNGPELNTPGRAGDYKGKKRSLYEGGIRVPAFMVWPAGIASPKVVSEPCSTSDYLPTLLDITGITYPKDRELDGESFWPWITGNVKGEKKALVFCSGNQGAVVQGKYKLYYSKGSYEVYDLEKDPYETTDLASQVPQVATKLKDILVLQLDEYKKSFSGAEYGQASFEKVPQKWQDVMTSKQN